MEQSKFSVKMLFEKKNLTSYNYVLSEIVRIIIKLNAILQFKFYTQADENFPLFQFISTISLYSILGIVDALSRNI